MAIKLLMLIKDGENGFETEIKSFGKCFATEDFKEGTTAFREKKSSFTLEQ
jgi:enoyl-CoA hydratase